jgi:hypothetical protein
MSELIVKGAIGLVAGGVWNLASVWSLRRLLGAWLGPSPSRRRALLWLLVKFPLLYLLAVALLRSPQVSSVGFGLGFTLVLIAAIAQVVMQVRSRTARHPHGR